MNSIVTDKDTIFVDELIRKNARLTVQHEADLQQRKELEAALARLKQENDDLTYQVETLSEDADGLTQDPARAKELSTTLAKAIADLHFVMANGDGCKVCTRKCAFGAGECKPVWRGEVEEAEQ